MSLKKDPSGKRSVQAEVEVPGTPEEVWAAIATGPGVSSWFVPADVDERPGGQVVCHFGEGFDSVATATAWDPPRRFAAESGDLAPDAPTLATEWIVEAKAGGTCVVRVVHSLLSDKDDWDDHLESIESGWPGFFRVLRLYLEHFRGLPCSTFRVLHFVPGPKEQAWSALTSALGIDGIPAGSAWSAPHGVPEGKGVVEHTGAGRHPLVLVRLAEPCPAIASIGANVFGEQVCLMFSFYLYGNQAAALAPELEAGWRRWLTAIGQ